MLQLYVLTYCIKIGSDIWSKFISYGQLQAAEARIHEANAGLNSGVEDNEDLDTPLQEVFSETQRYGRVARYELRPSRYGQAVGSASGFGDDGSNSRRVPDFPLVMFYVQMYK